MQRIAKPQVRTVHQKAKGPVDPRPGERVRALRLARGMTQGTLAGDDFTKGFISLVETGRTRMSLRAAEIIAGRLGTTVADLLAAGPGGDKAREVMLLRAEAELRAGRPADALELTRQLQTSGQGPFDARVQRIRGRALLDSGSWRTAVLEFDAALRGFRAAGHTQLAVRTLFDLARAHNHLDERIEALSLALECERAIQSGSVIDRTLELQLASFIATIYVTIGDYASADLRSERAKALAEDVTDTRAVAALYESLAVTRQEQGDYDAALDFARRALGAYEQLELETMVGSSWNTIGWICIQRRQFDRAEEALAKAEGSAMHRDDQALLGYVLQTRAELELARGRTADAIRMADASSALAGASERCKALSLLVRAQAVAASPAPLGEVRRAFTRAITALEPHGRRQLAKAHELRFHALNARGEFKQAAAAAALALDLMRPAVS
ncbi:MAG: hypothetical protein NVSMB8_01780 [Candidatus Limnocylindrales bacterium]